MLPPPRGSVGKLKEPVYVVVELRVPVGVVVELVDVELPPPRGSVGKLKEPVWVVVEWWPWEGVELWWW